MNNETRTQARSWWTTEECDGEVAVEGARTEAMTTKAERGRGRAQNVPENPPLLFIHSQLVRLHPPCPHTHTPPPAVTFLGR